MSIIIRSFIVLVSTIGLAICTVSGLLSIIPPFVAIGYIMVFVMCGLVAIGNI